ncbi:NADPH-dependent F420 reductase [Enterobacter quasiroggenkampii]|uniref:NADPH-dependent F420 reductase n=1 Tax=Enterobacter TaxID=547 RepID=UPI002FFBAE57
MKVAVIGTGKMGSGLASALVAAGHETFIGARDLNKADALAKQIGQGAQSGSVATAAKSAETIVLALPYASIKEVIAQAGDLTGKVIIDITNPVSADYKELTVGLTTSAAEEIQKLAPGAKVVKAFNTIFSSLLSSEVRKGKKLQVFIAGDNSIAKRTVADIAESIGFEPVESGPLSNSRFIEPVGEMNIHFAFFLGKGTVVAPAWVQL